MDDHLAIRLAPSCWLSPERVLLVPNPKPAKSLALPWLPLASLPHPHASLSHSWQSTLCHAPSYEFPDVGQIVEFRRMIQKDFGSELIDLVLKHLLLGGYCADLLNSLTESLSKRNDRWPNLSRMLSLVVEGRFFLPDFYGSPCHDCGAYSDYLCYYSSPGWSCSCVCFQSLFQSFFQSFCFWKG